MRLPLHFQGSYESGLASDKALKSAYNFHGGIESQSL